MAWTPNRRPLAPNPAPAPPAAAPRAWKDQKGARRRRLRELTPERRNLVEQLKDGRLTFEGYARELREVDRRLGR